jgi:hypothetical protein
MKPMIIAGVESLLYVVMKIAKNGEHVARRRIGPVDMWSDEQNKQNEAEVVDGWSEVGMVVKRCQEAILWKLSVFRTILLLFW